MTLEVKNMTTKIQSVYLTASFMAFLETRLVKTILHTVKKEKKRTATSFLRSQSFFGSTNVTTNIW